MLRAITSVIRWSERLLAGVGHTSACAGLILLPAFSAQAAHWTKLECSSIPSTGAPSYNTTIQCVAEITKPGAARWHNALRQNCSTFCSSVRGANIASPDGFWCTSGENRPWSAINARVDYSPTGCWHSCGQPEGTRGAVSVGDRCYAPGQKRDNDRTDFTVGCFCQTGDIGAGLLDVGLSSSGTAQARAVTPAAVANWTRVSKNVANDGSGRLFNVVGDVTVGNTASITMSVNVQGACGSTVSISGLLSQANGAQVTASPYTIALPACVPACRDGIDNDGDGRVDLADPDCSSGDDTSEAGNSIPLTECNDGVDNDRDGTIDALQELSSENGETFSVGAVPNRPGVFDPGLVQAAVLSSIRAKGLKVTLPIDNGAHLTRAISSQQSPKFDEGGALETSTLNQVCRVLGYQTYVSSTCRDFERSARYPAGKCTYHSPGDNAMWRFVNNDFVRENAYYHTWISSITCKHKLSACNDGWDNDGDGKIDSQDDGCASKSDNDERPHDTLCSSIERNSESEWSPSCVRRANYLGQPVSLQAARLDVNKDCLINELDIRLIINHINGGGFYRSDYDVNESPSFLGDGFISPLDPLTIIDFISADSQTTTPIATGTSTPIHSPASTPVSTPTLVATRTPTAVSPTTPFVTPISSLTATPVSTHTAASSTPLATGTNTARPTVTPTSEAQQTPVWPDQVGLIIFVPSKPFDPRASYDGLTGGPEAADAFCRQRALAGNLVNSHSRWRALISTSSRDARSLTGVSATSGNIVNRRGGVLAPNRASLWDASVELANAPGYDEFGEPISVSVATGSDARGNRLPPNFCSDFTDSNSTLSGVGTSSERSRSWISKPLSSPASCALISLYCVGNVQPIAPAGTPQTTPTTTSSGTPPSTPTSESSGTPGAPPTTISSDTPIASPTGSPTANSSGGNSVGTPGASPTNTAIASRTGGGIGELNPSTPPATPTSSTFSTSAGKPGQLSGKVEVDGREVPGALIYAPSLVNVVLSMKDGTWVMPELQDSSTNIPIKIRSTQFSNSGVDIPATIGSTLQVKSLKLRDYNPDKCKENDHLLNLYNAALRVRDLWLASANDHKGLIAGKAQAASEQESGRALRRAHYHAQTYFELSALLPDRELVCSSGQRACPSVSYNRVIRAMRQSATHLRHESLLFNRKLRLAGSRSEAESKQRIQSIRSGTRRLSALIQKLPMSSFDCSATPTAPALQSTSKRKRSRSRK